MISENYDNFILNLNLLPCENYLTLSNNWVDLRSIIKTIIFYDWQNEAFFAAHFIWFLRKKLLRKIFYQSLKI